jgi:hypothetical protein
MRPDVKTQIQRTKGVRQSTAGAAAYAGQEIADGELPAEDRQLVVKAVIDLVAGDAECVKTKNRDGTFTRTYSFPFKCAV